MGLGCCFVLVVADQEGAGRVGRPGIHPACVCLVYVSTVEDNNRSIEHSSSQLWDSLLNCSNASPHCRLRKPVGEGLISGAGYADAGIKQGSSRDS